MISEQEKTQVRVNQRPPVVVVLGHVDHGKTSLLDKIRQTNVASREAGGITQGIGAYEISHSGKKITFIDTPGHEAFSKMRARGAGVADIAILVVAADDGVEAQTKEAIKIIKQAGIPFVVAINKIDKTNADVDRVKNELIAEEVLLEGFGGSVSFQPISAKTGEGINELLDLVALTAELEELPFSLSNQGKGVILESKMDSRRGIIAAGIIKDGRVSIGDPIYSASASGKVRGLDNFLGKRIESAEPSSPVLISGFESLPEIGEEFFVGEGAKPKINRNQNNTREMNESLRLDPREENKDSRVINFILKADVSGSLEALSQIVKNIPKPEKTDLKIISQSVGGITDGDVKGAVSSKAVIIGFKVNVTAAGENLARAQNVKIITSEIIYDLVKAVEGEFKAIDKEIIKGDLEILAVFGRKSGNQIVGGKVTEGEIVNNSVPEVKRGEKFLGQAKILNLQKDKKNSATVQVGSECGLLIDSAVEIKVGDRLVAR